MPFINVQVVTAIIKSGLALSRKERSRSPLMYVWHETHYVGAAHGIVGILYMLLQASTFITLKFWSFIWRHKIKGVDSWLLIIKHIFGAS